MIWGNRRSAIAQLDASVETASLLDASHRFHSYRLEGVIDDSLLHRPVFPAGNLEERPALSILLHGRLLLRLGKQRRWIEAGEGYVIRSHSGFSWRILEGCHGLTVGWDAALAPWPKEPIFRLPAPQLEALVKATDRMHATTSVTDATSVHACAIDALQSTGLLGAGGFTKTDSDPALQALAMAIDARLSNLAEEPMQVELQEELGISERHLRRLTTELFKRYGFVDANWGEARVRRRLMTAVAFMSNSRATVSLVASEVGYHSTQAMSRAFSRAGFPSPSRIRKALDDLAEC